MYTYEDIKKHIAPHIASQLVCIFKNGSQLFCDNCKDYDYTIITSKGAGTGVFYVRELNTDFFVMSVKDLNRKMQNNLWRYKLSVCLAKIDRTNIIYGDLPELEIGILNLDYLKKTILPIEYEYALKTYFAGQGHPKTIVWGMALYYLIINGNWEFTLEQLALMQKYHDNPVVDEQFLKFLKTKMEKLISEVE